MLVKPVVANALYFAAVGLATACAHDIRPACAKAQMSRRPEGDATTSSKNEHQLIMRRARFGTIALVVRTIVLQFAVLGGGVVLRRHLEPADFGAFAITQFVLSFLAFFGDAGLGGALIQKKSEPTQRELSSVFWLQISLTFLVTLLIIFLAPWVVRFWPDLKARDGIWLFRALAIDLLFTSIRTIPSLLMERHLQFGRLSVLDVILTVAFYGMAVGFSLQGYGVLSLALAVVLQGFLGIAGSFALRPWCPSLYCDLSSINPIIRFGAFYQFKNVVGFLSGAVAPVYGGRVLGQRSVGFINWAQETAFFPLRITEIVSRVSFPLYSRLQGDAVAFNAAFGRAIRVCAVGTMMIVSVFLGLGPSFIHIVYTEKWMPALPLLYIYAVAISIGFLTPVVATALDALGRPQVTLRLSFLTTGLLFVLIPVLTPLFGTIGFAVGYGLTVVIGNFVAIFLAERVVPGVCVIRRLIGPAFSCMVATAAGRLVEKHVGSAATLIIAIVGQAMLYLTTLFLVDREALREIRSLLADARQATLNTRNCPILLVNVSTILHRRIKLSSQSVAPMR